MHHHLVKHHELQTLLRMWILLVTLCQVRKVGHRHIIQYEKRQGILKSSGDSWSHHP